MGLGGDYIWAWGGGITYGPGGEGLHMGLGERDYIWAWGREITYGPGGDYIWAWGGITYGPGGG